MAAILGVAPDSDHLARSAAMRVKNLADVSIEAVLRKVDGMPKTQRAYAQIVRSLESGLKANPEHVKALRTTADTQMLAGQLDKAEVTYRRALAIRPDDVMASRGLALTMHRTGRLDEAVPLYEFVLENIEDDVEIHNTLGAAFAQQGRMEMAVDQFKRALDIDPRHEGSRNNLSRARQAFLQGQAARKKKSRPERRLLNLFLSECRLFVQLATTMQHKADQSHGSHAKQSNRRRFGNQPDLSPNFTSTRS